MRRLIGTHGHRLAAGLFLSALLAGIYAPAAGAASPAVAWEIHQASFPTNLVPGTESEGEGPKYEIFVTNMGGAAAAGTTLTDTLPDGLTPVVNPSINVEPSFVYLLRSHEPAGEHGPCSVSGQTVTCTIAEAIAPGSSFKVTIPLAVASMPFAVVSNEVAVEGGGALATSTLETSVTPTAAPFAILGGSGLSAAVSDESGGVPAAGSHPFVTTFNVGVTKVGKGIPAEGMRNVGTELPQGLVVNPSASARRCKMSELALGPARNPTITCPPESQVGQSFVVNQGLLTHGVVPLYNMVPPPGVAAAFAFEVGQTVVVIQGGVSGGFHLTAASNELTSRFNISEVAFTLWGNPSDPRHDVTREGGSASSCLFATAGCSIEPSPAPFLTMPSSCTEPLDFRGTVISWQGSKAEATRPFTDADGNPIAVNGCNALEFNPTISSKATTNVADSPSGLDFSLHQPQNDSLDGLATAPLKDTTVTLPEGMTLNASAANGLDSCTEQQMGYAPEEGKVRFATAPQTCPNAAKLGTIEVKTPLLDHEVPGAIYLAKPYANPFGSLLSIYLAIEDEESGIVAKLAGKVTPDPVTGQLSATFTESPELPIEDIDLHFFNGAGAALTTPLTCGTKTTTSTLTPWSTPEGADAHPSDSFQTQVAAGGSGPCPTSEANAPNKPSFTAGTLAPQAGAYSPLLLKLARTDGSQRLTAIDTTLPKGLIGKLAGIPYCSEAQIAQAQARNNPNQGAIEQASPSCPAASEVGPVTVGAGSGPTPTYVQGHSYLAGPYKGAPLSLVVITPAVAGPFDLGAVVIRNALYVNSETAQIHAVSDPFPTIIAGIPLDLRSVSLREDHPDFILNPTSCDPMAITGFTTTLAGQSSPLSSPFQVGGCNALKFKPKLAIRLKGSTKRTGHPAVRAVVNYPQGNYANIARAQVTLPHSAFLDTTHIKTICTRVQFAADTCPPGAIYGFAKATTPLLDKPLEGPVYLRSSNHELPDLVLALKGQIDADAVARIDTGKGDGIRTTFEAVPDAPLSKVILEMKGGKKGLLVNSENICSKTQKAIADFTAQNGKVLKTTPTIANDCKAKAKKRGAKGKRGGKG